MHEEEFLETVRQEGSLNSNNAARNITDATLQTLGERITDGEAIGTVAAVEGAMVHAEIDPSLFDAIKTA